jgi:hypothetical protein
VPTYGDLVIEASILAWDAIGEAHRASALWASNPGKLELMAPAQAKEKQRERAMQDWMTACRNLEKFGTNTPAPRTNLEEEL